MIENTNSQTNRWLSDFLAGLTVSFAALALGAAFGVMSGRGAFAGMIGAAVIPIIASSFGGTRIQASGPTGPMTAITALLIANAYESFPDKTILAEQYITLTIVLSGLLMIICGLLRVGRLINYVPNAVIMGFMNGIAVLIWWDQLAKIFGVAGKTVMEGGFLLNISVALSVLLLILILPLIFKRIVKAKYRSLLSAVLISIILGSILSNLFMLPVQKVKLGSDIHSIKDFVTILKSYFPQGEILQSKYILMALPFALQLMVLGFLDSLLTALVIDKMTREKTKQNKELIAQGLANGISGLLQGIPGAQATIRSVLLIKENAQTRISGVLMGVFVLIWIVFFINWISLIPAAVFSGVLFKAGWDVTERGFTSTYFKNSWWKNQNRNFQFFLILYTTIITVVLDLNVAVITGTIIYYLAVYLFKKYKIKDVEDDVKADEVKED
ncbi:MAG: SulP family inorganic anion transporter [Bacteroidetes bacterium]|nr:SulP family inorganic anion transporter [Bacteroidota bacterium]